MLSKQEGKKIFDMDVLAADTTNADGDKMYSPKGSGDKDTYGPLSSVNPPISVASPKQIIQHGLKSYFSNQNTLLCIIKCLHKNIY